MPPPRRNRARRDPSRRHCGVFPWIATVDAFQHWIYTHPEPHARRTAAAWLDLMDRFGGDVDWSGHEEARAHLVAPAASHFPPPVLLHRIRHRATRRVAGLGQFKARQGEGAGRLQKSAGAGRFAVRCRNCLPPAGCRFEFSAKTIQPLTKLLREELGKL